VGWYMNRGLHWGRGWCPDGEEARLLLAGCFGLAQMNDVVFHLSKNFSNIFESILSKDDFSEF
jgi:hypothetical protein